MAKKPPKSLSPILAVTMGDPAGIGPEIAIKALNHLTVRRVCRPLLVGSLPIMERSNRTLNSPVKIIPVNGHQEAGRIYRRGYLPVLDPVETSQKPIRLGRPSAISGEMAVQSIKTAVRLAQDQCVNGIVTAPINKKAIHLAGHAYPGHTELLAKLTRTSRVGMMIVGGPLKVLFVTTHVAIRDLSGTITTAKVIRSIRLAHQGLQQFFSIPRPRIGVAGLNPHAGEQGLFGEEEQRVIGPAVKRAQALGIRCNGPHPADTLFGKAIHGEYDGIVAMYHDQGLIALKTVAFGQCVNLTVGLPILRTSVDHGTAYDIVGKRKADPSSMIEAIILAARLASASKN